MVAVPAPIAAQTVQRINAILGDPLNATAVVNEPVGRRLLHHDSTSAVLVVKHRETSDTLLVAGGGGGTAAASAVANVITLIESTEHRSVAIIDAVSTQGGGARGLTAFYLAIAGSSADTSWRRFSVYPRLPIRHYSPCDDPSHHDGLLRHRLGPRSIDHRGSGPQCPERSLSRTVTHWRITTGVRAAAVAMAPQVLFGVLGVGVTIVLFVDLNNASAGGAYPPSLPLPFWRVISGALPNKAGVDGVRRIVYFGASGIHGDLVGCGVSRDLRRSGSESDLRVRARHRSRIRPRTRGR